MKTIIQACVLFALVVMITTSSVSFVTHHTLKNELTSAVSNGTEQTLNLLSIYKAYPYSSQDEVIADVIQNIIMAKSSSGPLTINIYNKDDIKNGILEVEAIEPYQGLGGAKRQASYRTRAYVYYTDEGVYVKYADPSTETVPSETWVFSSQDVEQIRAFFTLEEGKFPSESRNADFLTHFGDCLEVS